MKRIAVALVAGLLFGLGLTVSGMVNPAKVQGFLDFAGDWDPSLALVMGGAIPVAAGGFAIARRRRTPVCNTNFVGPSKTRIDARLVVGAALFGIGWGLAGYCPGPALASLSFGGGKVLIFVAAMLTGMALFQWLDPRLSRRKAEGRA
jgi:uncharacterized membrane protein YedE/YeeE